MRLPIRLSFLIVVTAARFAPAAEPAGNVISLLQDFETETVLPSGWKSPGKSAWSSDTPHGKRCLLYEIPKEEEWPYETSRPLVISRPYFPPEADAIRMRIKVDEGKFLLSIGGPTAYFGNSDAFTEMKVLEKSSDWATVEFSLNERLFRNFRRAGFSAKASRIYYSRWAQEPTFLVIWKGSYGRFRLDQIELVAKGEGKPFPVYAEKDVTVVKNLIDFEKPEDKNAAFSALLADNQESEFENSWTRAKAVPRPPAVSALSPDSVNGKQSLVATAEGFYEEISWAGVKVAGAKGANAVRITLKVKKAEHRDSVVRMKEDQPIDIALFTAPPETPFDWKPFAAPDELRKNAGPGFDYNFSYYSVRKMSGASFAFHHARRYVVHDTWTAVVIPLSDFVSFYGSGRMEAQFLSAEPLKNSDEIIAVAALLPFPRWGKSKSTSIFIDDIALVCVPEKPGERAVSFWQAPDPGRLHMVDDAEFKSHGGLRHWLPKEIEQVKR